MKALNASSKPSSVVGEYSRLPAAAGLRQPPTFCFPSKAAKCRGERAVCHANLLELPRVRTSRPSNLERGFPHGVRVPQSLDLDDITRPTVAYELLQGSLNRFTRADDCMKAPTVVLVHGILGSKRNMQGFARLILQAFPAWQVLLVDLRCHGQSAMLPNRPEGPHGVHAAANDVLNILNDLKLFPHVLIGHSFGGKVVMAMVQQFGARLPRPVQVWALDTLPGEVRAGDIDGHDHPRVLIETLRSIPTPVSCKRDVMDLLVNRGFSQSLSRWVSTNLQPLPGVEQVGPHLMWTYDLEGVYEMWRSYESTSMWDLLESPPAGLTMHFVKADRSEFRWSGSDERVMRQLGHEVHLLTNSGHWVHTDNPQGLIEILSTSFNSVGVKYGTSAR